MRDMVIAWDGTVGRAYSETGAFCPWAPAGYVASPVAERRHHRTPRIRRVKPQDSTRARLLTVVDETPRTSVDLARLAKTSVLRVSHELYEMTQGHEVVRVRTSKKRHGVMYLYRRGPAAPVLEALP